MSNVQVLLDSLNASEQSLTKTMQFAVYRACQEVNRYLGNPAVNMAAKAHTFATMELNAEVTRVEQKLEPVVLCVMKAVDTTQGSQIQKVISELTKESLPRLVREFKELYGASQPTIGYVDTTLLTKLMREFHDELPTKLKDIVGATRHSVILIVSSPTPSIFTTPIGRAPTKSINDVVSVLATGTRDAMYAKLGEEVNPTHPIYTTLKSYGVPESAYEETIDKILRCSPPGLYSGSRLDQAKQAAPVYFADQQVRDNKETIKALRDEVSMLLRNLGDQMKYRVDYYCENLAHSSVKDLDLEHEKLMSNLRSLVSTTRESITSIVVVYSNDLLDSERAELCTVGAEMCGRDLDVLLADLDTEYLQWSSKHAWASLRDCVKVLDIYKEFSQALSSKFAELTTPQPQLSKDLQYMHSTLTKVLTHFGELVQSNVEQCRKGLLLTSECEYPAAIISGLRDASMQSLSKDASAILQELPSIILPCTKSLSAAKMCNVSSSVTGTVSDLLTLILADYRDIMDTGVSGSFHTLAGSLSTFANEIPVRIKRTLTQLKDTWLKEFSQTSFSEFAEPRPTQPQLPKDLQESNVKSSYWKDVAKNFSKEFDDLMKVQDFLAVALLSYIEDGKIPWELAKELDALIPDEGYDTFCLADHLPEPLSTVFSKWNAFQTQKFKRGLRLLKSINKGE